MTQSYAHLFKLTILLFNAALGQTYYRQSAQALANSDIQSLAASWGESDLALTYLGSNTEEQTSILDALSNTKTYLVNRADGHINTRLN